MFGKELIIDLHDCDPGTFNRRSITNYFDVLCRRIDMHAEDLHFWDYQGEEEAYKKAPDHLKGTSAVQFIRTSNITIHTLDILKKVYLNIFSCKDFNPEQVIRFSEEWFEGKAYQIKIIRRK